VTIAEYVVDTIANGLLVLRTRDKSPITNEQINERARNIATVLLATLCIEKPCEDDECPKCD
jgi:hypothetical protein